jgi:hypothetical protein
MIHFLVDSNGFHQMTREQMLKDPMLKIVSSSCEEPLERVVEIAEKIISERKGRKNDAR